MLYFLMHAVITISERSISYALMRRINSRFYWRGWGSTSTIKSRCGGNENEHAWIHRRSVPNSSEHVLPHDCDWNFSCIGRGSTTIYTALSVCVPLLWAWQ